MELHNRINIPQYRVDHFMKTSKVFFFHIFRTLINLQILHHWTWFQMAAMVYDLMHTNVNVFLCCCV